MSSNRTQINKSDIYGLSNLPECQKTFNNLTKICLYKRSDLLNFLQTG
ncbi:hypothetical protein MHA_2034 [Mannheimia haemolytica PHL213]|nr:hypothetical protein MHA_2034 [Mannheimia haemolytica PHL213]